MAQLLNKKQVAELIGCHPQTVIRHASNGDFPSPIRFGGRGHPRWGIADVQAWLSEQKSERQPEKGRE